MIHHEDQQLNYPVKKYFEKKLKCAVSKSEFKFIAGKLDVLAYDRENRCFHICEGKRASNTASVGHAVGQLIAYMSMIQENGYNFLNKISKEARLELTDFATFLENRAINVCFYVGLPAERKDKLLNPAQLMLSNMGSFGESIGVFFASKQKCELVIPAKSIPIKIRRLFDRKEFLSEVSRKFFLSSESKGLIENPPSFPNCLQIKESGGNPFLHYEVWTRSPKKNDSSRIVEVAFHLEFAKAHYDKKGTTEKRVAHLKRIMSRARTELKKRGFDFKYQATWGKRWSRLYTSYNVNQIQLDDKALDETLTLLKALITVSKPMFDKINWGRQKKNKEDNC